YECECVGSLVDDCPSLFFVCIWNDVIAADDGDVLSYYRVYADVRSQCSPPRCQFQHARDATRRFLEFVLATHHGRIIGSERAPASTPAVFHDGPAHSLPGSVLVGQRSLVRTIAIGSTLVVDDFRQL